MSALSPICAEDSWSPGSVECARNYQGNTDYSFHNNDNILVGLTHFLKLCIMGPFKCYVTLFFLEI